MNSLIPNLIILVGFLISMAGSFIVARKVTSKLESGQISQNSLTTDEKRLVYILTILQPFWAGFVFYFEWKNRLPIKAKETIRIAFIAFGLWLIASVLIGWPLDLSV